MPGTISFAAGDYSCTVDPALGGSILALRWRGFDLLRPGHDAADVLETASFPLVPFANRIDHAQFAYEGALVTLDVEPGTAPHAHHGHGWRTAWSVVESSDWSVTLGFERKADGWPSWYRARQRFTLADEGLLIEILVENLSGERTMPVGAGIHPYFKRHAGSRLTTRADRIWLNDATGMAVESEADMRFNDVPVAIAVLEGIDNFFEGPADLLIEGGSVPVRMTGEPAAGFHIYVPAGEEFFCVEPVSHAPNSFGRGQFAPVDVLAGRETRTWSYRIAVA